MSEIRIAIVLSTYNGERYLDDQLASLFRQRLPEGTDVTVFVRDDGSSDKTQLILSRYTDSHFRLTKGDNVGVSSSFMSALCSVPLTYDFIALCDQDDVWHEDKLARAINVLSNFDHNIPRLYCSEYIFCDAELNPIGKSTLNKSGVNFEKLLFENICSGNTMVMNRALHEAVRAFGSEGVYCHDWWIALSASALGEIHYDRQFYSLDYRRIGSNASPTGSGVISLLQYRFSKFIKGGDLEKIQTQLQKLLDETGDRLDPSKTRTLELFLSRYRLRKVFAGVRLRQTITGELMLRALFLLGWL